MKFRAPKLLQNSAIYSGISILQRGISFFLLPLYTAFLTPSDYGVMNVMTSLSSLVSLFILLGLSGAGTRFNARNPNDEGYMKVIWGSIATFVLLNSIFIVTIFIVFHQFIIDPILGNISFYPYVLLALANVVVTPLYLLFQDYLRSRQMGLHYGINTLSNFIINTLLIILFVAVYKKGVVGVLLANLLTSILYFIYVAIFFVPKLKIALNKEVLRPAFKYSLPLVPHLLAGWSSGMIDRFLLNGLKDERDTGLYSVANQFGHIVLVFSSAFNSAYIPWFFRAYDNQKFSEIRKVGLFTVLCNCAIALLLSMFAPEVLKIMVSEEFREVWAIIPLICFAYVFQGMYYLFTSTLFLEKTGKVFYISVTTMIINIALNIILIPRMGYVGSALACFLSFFIKSLVALVLSSKYESKLRFRWLVFYVLTFGMFGLTFSNHLFINMSILSSIGIKLMIVTGVSLIIFLRYRQSILQNINLILKK